MRKMVLSLMSVAALSLVGCSSSSSSNPSDGSASAPDGAAKIPSQISGTITIRGTPQLSAHDSLVIKLVDISSTADAGAPPLASKTVAPASQFPLSFELPIKPSDVKPDDLYVVKAELVDGDRHYTMPIQAPVLTKGSPSTVTVQLVPEQTPAEKTLAAFSSVQAQLGGMKFTHGTKLESDASRSWQVFRQDGQLKLIRELVDYGKKGFTTTDYAYKDGKPWVVVQQTLPSQGAKPSAVDRAGWDGNGNLLLKEHDAGGSVQPLDPDAASNLQKEALQILGTATDGKNK